MNSASEASTGESRGENVYTLKHELSARAVQTLINELAQSAACRDVLIERLRQDLKWGEQNHDPQTYLSILVEEVGEAAKEANDARWPKAPTNPAQVRDDGKHIANFRAEMVQVAAVALAMVECLDRGKWQWPK